MEKVLILSYFFPPCNLTAANRTGSWAAQLSKFGFYPIVVTRNWDVSISDQSKLSVKSGESLRIEKKEGYEVHYVPFKPGLRDRLYTSGKPVSLLSKPLTVVELFGQHFSSSFVPYDNLKKYCSKFLSEQQDIKLLIASAGPYPLFRFAAELKRQFPRLQWIADYRDDWSTKTLNRSKGVVSDLLHRMDQKSEKQWVHSASKVLSVSDLLTRRITEFTGTSGTTVPNGYAAELMEEVNAVENRGEFIISYSGYLYDAQPVESFLHAVKKVATTAALPIKVRFIGLSYYKPAEARVLAAMKGFENLLEITPRVPLEDCIRMEKSSDLLLMMAYGSEKGIPASKVYQYVGTAKPVFLFPSDGDIIEKILTDTGQALIPKTETEAVEMLHELLERKQSGKALIDKPDRERIYAYSRAAQSKKLAAILEQLIHSPVS